MWHRIKLLLEMIRFSHTIFALPFALLAAVMAWLAPSDTEIDFRSGWLLQLLGILICMVGARSAAMAFNRLVDRDIDAKNPRTANRHLPAGSLSVSSVVGFTVGTSLLFIAGTLCFLPNCLPLVLSPFVLIILCGYSYTKRFTSLAHAWLGMSLSLAPICARIAVRGLVILEMPGDLLPAGILGLAVLFWVTGFDIIYACQDYEFDRESKLFSIPTRFGVPRSLRLAAICHGGMMIVLVGLALSHHVSGPDLGLGWIYWVGLGLTATLLGYEHYLVRPDDLTKVNIAFFTVNSVISVGLFLVVSADMLLN